jgi:hypothetical protein
MVISQTKEEENSQTNKIKNIYNSCGVNKVLHMRAKAVDLTCKSE